MMHWRKVCQEPVPCLSGENERVVYVSVFAKTVVVTYALKEASAVSDLHKRVILFFCINIFVIVVHLIAPTK
jgi:hypothetical protein